MLIDESRTPNGPISLCTAASKLSRAKFRRYLRGLELEHALAHGKQPPSRLGRLFRPATDERTLVLFTLGITVIMLIIAVFVIEMWAIDSSQAATASLVTLAGTGLGFIGGMVSDHKKPGERLAKLAELRAKGLITDADYEAQSKKIVDNV